MIQQTLKIMAKKEKERRPTPIIDGDARPDVPVDTESLKEKERAVKPSTDKKFEAERSSDINSLEDYKDAK
jgi:hypothetical protein